MQVSQQRAGFTAACGFHSSVRVSQQRAGSFTAACGFHSSTRVSQQHAGFTQYASFTAARGLKQQHAGLNSSTRASQQHAGFTAARELHMQQHTTIAILAISSLQTTACVTTTVANKEIDSHQHSGKPAELLSCMQWKQDVRFFSRMVYYRRCSLCRMPEKPGQESCETGPEQRHRIQKYDGLYRNDDIHNHCFHLHILCRMPW